MNRLFLCFAAALMAALASCPALAAPQPSEVEAGTYALERMHTRVLFAVDHLGFTTYYGEFTGASGSLKLDPRNLSAISLDVRVPTASVSTTSSKLDAELKGADWLDAAKDPFIRFRATEVVTEGADAAKVRGELTLHGVSRPVTFDAKLHGQGINPLSKKTTIGFDVHGKIKRSDFGVKTYVPLIGDEVDIIISAAFEKSS